MVKDNNQRPTTARSNSFALRHFQGEGGCRRGPRTDDHCLLKEKRARANVLSSAQADSEKSFWHC